MAYEWNAARLTDMILNECQLLKRLMSMNHYFFFDSEFYSMTGKVIEIKNVHLLIKDFKSSRYVYGESYFAEENQPEYILPFECVETAIFIDINVIV